MWGMAGYLKPLTKSERTLITSGTHAGVVVLFDIMDSTRRKLDSYEGWALQTATVYRAFGRFTRDVARSLKGGEPSPKLIGDGLMCFFPLAESHDVDLPESQAFSILRRVVAFRREVHDGDDALLGGMRLRSVVTFLRGVRDVAGERINRGVDFTFRLEKFGDARSILVNTAFREALTDGALGKLRLREKERREELKGWDGPQPFVELRERD
jgi:class 3 adenylate cyclase